MADRRRDGQVQAEAKSSVSASVTLSHPDALSARPWPDAAPQKQ